MAPPLCVYHGAGGRAVLIELRQSLRLQASTRYRWVFALQESGSGSFRFAVGGRCVPLSAGGVIAVAPLIAHCYRHASSSPPLTALLLDVLPAPRSKPRPALAAGLSRAGVADTPHLGNDVEALAGALRSGPVDTSAETAVARRFRQLANTLLDHADGLAGIEGGNRAGNDRRIDRAIRLLQARWNEPLAVDLLAPKVGLSRAQFFLMFQRHIGLTPATYWNMLRMEQALAALASQTQPLPRLAARLGFSAPSNFVRFFRSFQGTTPERYRQAVLGAGREQNADRVRNACRTNKTPSAPGGAACAAYTRAAGRGSIADNPGPSR